MVSSIVLRVSVRLFAAVVVCWIGIHTTLFFLVPRFETEGAIRIVPINPIIFHCFDPRERYLKFKNSQAEIMCGDTILNRVADKLSTKNLECFSEVADPVIALKKMIADENIKIIPEESSELLRICMISVNPSQAEQIVNAFLDEYMAYVDSEEASGGSEKLKILEDKKKTLEEKIESQLKVINTLLEEFGTEELTSRQEMVLEIVSRLQEDLTATIIHRIALEDRVKIIEKDKTSATDTNQMERQNAYPNANSKLQKSQNYALAQAKAELKQVREQETKLREWLDKQDGDTIGKSRKQIKIDDLKEELAQTKTLYNQVCRRIEEIEFEQQRPAMISIASRASSCRVKYWNVEKTIWILCIGLLTGILFAFLPGSKGKASSPDHMG